MKYVSVACHGSIGAHCKHGGRDGADANRVQQRDRGRWPPHQYADTPSFVITDLGPTVDYDCTAAYGANASATEMGIRSAGGKNFLGTTCRQMTGTINGLAEAIANGVYIEMRLG